MKEQEHIPDTTEEVLCYQRTCPHCGKELYTVKLAFCPYCGTKLLIDPDSIGDLLIAREKTKQKQLDSAREMDIRKSARRDRRFVKAFMIVTYVCFFAVFLLFMFFFFRVFFH